MTAGGAKYKLFAPLMNGMSCAIDALWAIKQMVFTEEAIFTLPGLLKCLICDWGHDMKEPFYSKAIGEDRIAVQAERFKHLRKYAWYRLPKFGQGHDEVDRFGRRVVRDLVNLAFEVIRQPTEPIAGQLQSLRDRFGTEEHPFEFVITPGVATFEDYAGVGSFLGASAEGRRHAQTVASDCSPSPTPPDLPVPAKGRPAVASLTSWAAGPTDDSDEVIDPIGVGVSNGSPVDINIREDFPLSQAADLVRGFARGELGGNMMTISIADPDTLAEAQRFPERYDLLRMRMGGWSEFFVAMFPHHQEQHKRRPLFEAAEQQTEESAEVPTAWGGLARRGRD
jgi:pyruvate-formate lyase